ncbi:ABC transporter permease [Clostridium sp. UBA4548]|uniref:ABC transporter permease n=1 Tax=Clostridium sp. UBA4548 TaxID=1946361 RepID=UPI0025BDD01E|nr:ABC transporter permease [Clostridium sp. UBA4548]
MFKLMKLEMKKFKVAGYIKGAIIANLVIIGIMIAGILISKSEGDLILNNYNFAFQMVDSSVKATFIIFASVLLSKLIIEEYKNGTMTLLFMYPINRKKLIVAKLIIVLIFTFVAIFLSNIFIDGILIAINSFTNFIPDEITKEILSNAIISINTSAVTSAFMSLIPLYFGMRKKSVPTTIISSILIVTVMCSNANGFSLSSIVIIPIIFSFVGAFIAYLSIRNIEHVDVSK